jgi:hypothetical protein
VTRTRSKSLQIGLVQRRATYVFFVWDDLLSTGKLEPGINRREKLLFCYIKSEEDIGCVNEQSIHAPACGFCVAVSKCRKTYKQPRRSQHGPEMNMIRERKTDL